MSDAAPSAFATTRWTVVVAAGSTDTGEAREALGVLCRAYWMPLYVFARRRGADEATAQDLVQGFFAKVVERGIAAAADPARGRFRTFLLAAFRNFAADQHDRDVAAKRGGDTPPLSLDVDFADGEARFRAVESHEMTPERAFERRWALDLLSTALRRTIAEIETSDAPALGRDLLPFVGGPGAGSPYAEIAARHATTEGAVKTAVHRIRRAYRGHLRAVIRDTVTTDADVEDEIRDLLAAVASP
ncbi:MAG: sigma-70 family RNA polymerase sigma factor [Planctomycetes bacterium]|nr:sigma-70 family RNA polymerase sigma factor [Planctomycetota bacterium]